MLTSCNEENTTEEVVTPTVDSGSFNDVWAEEYQDNESRFNEHTVLSTKLFYEGEYVPLSTSVSKRKDNKKEFYTNEYLRFVNAPEKYAITLPSDTKIDYSIASYRMQFEFGDSVLTLSHETKNPYGSNSNGWKIYFNEWVNRYVNNPKYLEDNNLSYTEDVSLSLDILPGYEVITYSIKINDSDKIDKPYYNISVVRGVKEFTEFYLLVMKSKTNQNNEFKDIIKSFKKGTDRSCLW